MINSKSQGDSIPKKQKLLIDAGLILTKIKEGGYCEK